MDNVERDIGRLAKGLFCLLIIITLPLYLLGWLYLVLNNLLGVK